MADTRSRRATKSDVLTVRRCDVVRRRETQRQWEAAWRTGYTDPIRITSATLGTTLTGLCVIRSDDGRPAAIGLLASVWFVGAFLVVGFLDA